MKHVFRSGVDPDAPTLLMLHGTGGNEKDLLPLARILSPDSAVLSPLGNVRENGMPRFFRRLAEGVFDEEDLLFRTKELKEFIDESAEKYELDRKQVVAVGYSNGANIAGSLLFHYPGVLCAAILHHPMVPRRGVALPDLSDVPVFIGAGRNDPICAPSETDELQRLLESAGASVHVHWEHAGHQLTRAEVEAASRWLRDTFKTV
ncbi:alpha/beta hydrolase [Desmospora profundinema]|uniref:Phospholipase/carboxylesterase n=1 Tax=Desmospora profundinema TaxID=1571184 RepID=A0ABU1IR49_9BACL|nr:alpha/beta hydrolase [Desmospora profundinema]MDR6226409.1 phospholipase/carboxylesterase [Desmospora profundinema]